MIRLAYLFGRTSDPVLITSLLSENLRGEITTNDQNNNNYYGIVDRLSNGLIASKL